MAATSDVKDRIARFHEAVQNNDINRVKDLISSRALDSIIDDEDSEGFTALYLACMKHHATPAMAQLLLKAGAKVDRKGADRETPLYISVFNHRVAFMQVLLAAGAQVNEVNGQGDTTLHCAAKLGYDDLVDALADKGANVNARNGRLETPLYLAAKAGRHNTVYKLLLRDANRLLGDEEGKTPLFVASEGEHKAVVALLKADKDILKSVKASVDVDVKNRKASISDEGTLQKRASIIKMADASAAAAEANAGKGGSGATASPDRSELVKIDIPAEVERTHDPLTGKALPARYKPMQPQEPPKIPEGAIPKAKPEVAYGGTIRKVGTGTGESIKQPEDLLSTIPGDTAIVFQAAGVKPVWKK